MRSFVFFPNKLFFLRWSFSNKLLNEERLEEGVLDPLPNPENPILFLKVLLVVVWGCPLKENSIEDWLNSLGKLLSFIKLTDILAMELEDEEGLEELLKLPLESDFNVLDSVRRLSNEYLSLVKLIVLRRLVLLILTIYN